MKYDYTKLDASILATLGTLAQMVDGAPGCEARVLLKPSRYSGGNTLFRMIDSRLQKMRKEGKIEYVRPTGWRLTVDKPFKWLPISTAPRDQWLLAIKKGTHADGLPYRPVAVNITEDGLVKNTFGPILLSEWGLTHWMPLPGDPE